VMWEIKTPWRSSRRPGPFGVDRGQRDGVLSLARTSRTSRRNVPPESPKARPKNSSA
jgi:hypothetical protein